MHFNQDDINTGERLRGIRESMKMNREEFSEKIDITDSFLGQIERGERALSVKTLRKVVKYTGVSADYLLFGKDNLIDCLWNYAIKKELVLEFPKGMYHEDFATMPLMILKAKTMVSINKYEYYYVQSQNSIMRNQNEEMERKKLQDKLVHFDNLLKQSKKMPLKKMTKENLAIFATNSLLAVIPDLDEENKIWFEKELKSRKIAKNIKIRSFKQFIKRIMLEVKY